VWTAYGENGVNGVLAANVADRRSVAGMLISMRTITAERAVSRLPRRQQIANRIAPMTSSALGLTGVAIHRSVVPRVAQQQSRGIAG
jgi:hypothetical protein